MDRFKFRVWDSVEKEYVEEVDCFRITQAGRLIFNNAQNKTEPEANNKRFIIEQCTGLKDKNGKLIYDGDIVKCSGQAFIVEWRQDRLSFVLSNDENLFESYDITYFEIEVIGNIHENPELLENKYE